MPVQTVERIQKREAVIRKNLSEKAEGMDAGVRKRKIKQLPNISPEGGERKTMVEITDLVLENFIDGVQKVSFSLPKGSYATVVIKELV